MADAGARKIKDLLDTPSRTLGDNMKALRTGLRAATDDDATAPASLINSVSKLLSYYRRLHLKIEGTKTSSAAKKDVTKALFQMESALASLSEGLKLGVADGGTQQLDTAQRRAARAAADLGRASKRLA